MSLFEVYQFYGCLAAYPISLCERHYEHLTENNCLSFRKSQLDHIFVSTFWNLVLGWWEDHIVASMWLLWIRVYSCTKLVVHRYIWWHFLGKEMSLVSWRLRWDLMLFHWGSQSSLKDNTESSCTMMWSILMLWKMLLDRCVDTKTTERKVENSLPVPFYMLKTDFDIQKNLNNFFFFF